MHSLITCGWWWEVSGRGEISIRWCTKKLPSLVTSRFAVVTHSLYGEQWFVYKHKDNTTAHWVVVKLWKVWCKLKWTELVCQQPKPSQGGFWCDTLRYRPDLNQNDAQYLDIYWYGLGFGNEMVSKCSMEIKIINLRRAELKQMIQQSSQFFQKYCNTGSISSPWLLQTLSYLSAQSKPALIHEKHNALIDKWQSGFMVPGSEHRAH